MPEFIFDQVSEEQYQTAGSKFITMPLGAKLGDTAVLDCEIGMLDWDTPGVSMKCPITITEKGPDEGKEDKISFGIAVGGIWKGKEIYHAVTSQDMPMKAGADGKPHPSIDPQVLTGKPAVALYQLMEGKKGGVGEPVKYPKLISILAPGSKLSIKSIL